MSIVFFTHTGECDVLDGETPEPCQVFHIGEEFCELPPWNCCWSDEHECYQKRSDGRSIDKENDMIVNYEFLFISSSSSLSLSLSLTLFLRLFTNVVRISIN